MCYLKEGRIRVLGGTPKEGIREALGIQWFALRCTLKSQRRGRSLTPRGDEEDKEDEEAPKGNEQKIKEVDVEKENEEKENEESRRGLPLVGATQQRPTSLHAEIVF